MTLKQLIDILWSGLGESLYMTLVSTLMAYVLGLPIGVILAVTDKGGIAPNRWVNLILGIIVNILRSVPFIILLVTVMPFTRLVVGTTLGSSATVVPLVIASAPYVGRLVESSLKEVPGGVIEAARAMGTGNYRLITKVLIPEAKPSLVVGAAIAITTILSYSAMAGFVGGGGLGSIAINYGYYRYNTNVMLATVAVLVIIVQVFQEAGMYIAKKVDKRIR